MKRKREEADAEAYQKTVKRAFKFKGGGSLSKKSKKKKKRKKKSASAAEGADPADFFHAPVEVDAAAAIKKQKEEAELLQKGKSLLRTDRQPAKSLSKDYMRKGGRTDGNASQRLNDRIKKKRSASISPTQSFHVNKSDIMPPQLILVIVTRGSRKARPNRCRYCTCSGKKQST